MPKFFHGHLCLQKINLMATKEVGANGGSGVLN